MVPVALLVASIVGLSTGNAATLGVTGGHLTTFTAGFAASRCSHLAVAITTDRFWLWEDNVRVTPPPGCGGKQYSLTAYDASGQAVVVVENGTLAASGSTTVATDWRWIGTLQGAAITIGTSGMQTSWS